MMIKAVLLVAFMCRLLPSVQAADESADEAFNLSPEEENPTGEDVLTKRKEKFQRDEIMVYDSSNDLGFTDRRRWTGDDRNKISASFHLNGQYEYLSQLQGIEATWLRRTDNWHKLWWGATYKRTNAEFRNIADNNPNENVTARKGRAKESINTLGLGVGYRLRLLMDFPESDKIMETVQVFGTYNTLHDSSTDFNYRGYGMTADYGLHWRTRSSFFYGGKFTYNRSWVERSQSNTPSEARSLSLSWYTFALEGGFYF